ESLIKGVISIQLCQKVIKVAPRIKQLAKTLDLLNKICWGEVIDTLKFEADRQRALSLIDMVCNRARNSRPNRFEDFVEIIAIDLNELAILQCDGIGGCAGQIRKNADDKRQFLFLNCTAYLDVICDLHSRWTNSVKLM